MQQLNATSDITITAISVDYSDDSSSLFLKTKDAIAVDDELFIDDEIVKITNISGVDLTKSAVALRGLYNTRKTGHNLFNDQLKVATINGRYSPIGLEGVLTNENDETLGTFYLTDYKSNGASIILNFQNILNKFDKDFFISRFELEGGLFPFVNQALKSVYKGVLNTSLTFDDLVKDLRFKDNEFKPFITFNPMETLKKLLTLTGSYLVFNSSTNTYNVKALLGYSIFESIGIQVDIYDKVLLNAGGYESTIKNLATNLQIKYSQFEENWQEKYSNELILGNLNIPSLSKSFLMQAHTSGASLEAVSEVKDLDLEDYVVEAGFSFSKIARQYMYVYGLILGHIKINTIANHNFEEGKYYSVDGIADFREVVAFVDKTKDYILFCYAQDSEMARFIILDISAYQPISAGLILRLNSSTQAQLNRPLTDFLYAEGADLENATHIDFGYNFFEAGQAVQIRDVNTYELLASATILSVVGNKVNLTSGLFPAGNLANSYSTILTMGAKTGTLSDIQNKHLFVDSGVL